jgi:hypothetical protein
MYQVLEIQKPDFSGIWIPTLLQCRIKSRTLDRALSYHAASKYYLSDSAAVTASKKK